MLLVQWYVQNKPFMFFYSLFDGNTGENSIVSIGLQIFNLSGTNRFVNNKGSALRVCTIGLACDSIL